MALRLFAALDVPDDVADRLIALQRGVPGARWRPRENLHLTLRFFGEVPEDIADDLDAALDEAAQDFAPFDFGLKGAGFFGKEMPHTLWIGAAESDALSALAAACERAARRAGLKPEARKFAPHVTLASLDGSALDRVVAFERRYALFESRVWRVNAFGLYSSWVRRGAPSLFREEAAYPLLRAA
jgi:RNA 2',3'-cyclic 3'-phosphodiesterase